MRIIWPIIFIIFSLENAFALSAPISTTKATGLFFDSDKKIELRQPLENRFLIPFLYGQYVSSSSLWDGYIIYLFPNMKFAIYQYMEFRKDGMISYGTWTYQEGIISLKHEYLDSLNQSVVNDGRLTNFYFFLKSRDDVVGDSVLIPEDDFKKVKNKDNSFNYFMREIAYYDWEKVFRDHYPRNSADNFHNSPRQ